VDDPSKLASLLCSRAIFEHGCGRADAARAALAEAEALAVRVGAAEGSDLHFEITRAGATLAGPGGTAEPA